KIGLPGVYWCDATNRAGCVYRDSVLITGRPLPAVALGNDTTICENTSLLLDATGAGDGYLWQNKSTASTCLVKDSGMYYVTVTKDGCTGADTINISLHRLPRPDLGNDIRICSGESVVLNPGVNDAVKIQWQDGSLQPSLAVSAPGVYVVTVTNSCGVATDKITVETGPCAVRFPNAFTPDGNGTNDIFKALNAFNVKEFRMQVFNRWGQKLFETNNPAEGWTGKTPDRAREPGVYVWTASYTDNSGRRVNRKGTVLLIR
ncbi:MAG TPA: gliding motility-associated C-terminal domain-containing protein, partial [Chitinophagaceae bacterium]|nr:gliding motility-associated C-terminal domain-containing protein [Chitinophagaceae bacterium]